MKATEFIPQPDKRKVVPKLTPEQMHKLKSRVQPALADRAVESTQLHYPIGALPQEEVHYADYPWSLSD
ncbi:MAG: hypothetical protein WBO49_01435 [Candidatus Saccharimonas sp.]